MGDHKERTGQTRISKILQGIGKALPALAGDIVNVVTSPNPFGGAWNVLKGKLKSELTGEVGDNFHDELENVSGEDKDLFLAGLADVAGARTMYAKTGHEQADKVAENIMKRNLPYLVGLASVNILILVFSEKLDLNTPVVLAVGNVIGMVIQSLINERAQVVGFYMGSSIGSKIKDKAKSLFN
jgi:hypothetical protein